MLSNPVTKDVDIHGGGGPTTAVGSLYDVGGSVVSLGLGNSDGGVSWLGVDGDPVVWLEDQVSLSPLHSGLRLTFNFSREFDLTTSLGSEAG